MKLNKNMISGAGADINFLLHLFLLKKKGIALSFSINSVMDTLTEYTRKCNVECKNARFMGSLFKTT